jgi:hypothetical protein
MRSLENVLTSHYGLDLTGWELRYATGISDDGLTIVGGGRNPSGQLEGWRAVLDISEPAMPCFEVNKMKVMDKVKGDPIRDKIKLMGTMSFGPGSDPFDPPPAVTPAVTVTISDDSGPPEITKFTLDAGLLEQVGSSNNYMYKGDLNDGRKVKVQFLVDECLWKVKIKGDAATSALYDHNFVDDGPIKVTVDVGGIVGTDTFADWTKKKITRRPKVRLAKFKEDPKINCCDCALDGLVGYYPLDGNADDESGNDNDGTEYGGVSYEDGIIGQAASFDGVDDYIQVAHNVNLDINPTTGFTVATWFKADSTQPYSFSELVDKSHGDDGTGYDDHRGWVVHRMPAGHLQFGFGDGATWHSVNSTGTVLDDQWHHVAATVAGTTMKLYVDGALTDTNTSVGTPASNTRDLFIGKHYALTRDFRGDMDDIRIYNRALSEDEIQCLSDAE